MNIKISDIACDNIENVVVPVFEDGKSDYICDDVKAVINTLKNKEQFKGKCGEVFFFTKNGENNFKQVILLGLGKEEGLTSEKIRVAYSKALRKAKELKLQDLSVRFFESEKVCRKSRIKAIAEGMALANYAFNNYKSDKKESTIKNINVIGVKDEDKNKVQEGLDEANSLINAIYEARNLVNEPANTIYPETLAKRAEELGKEFGFEVEVFGENKIQELKMEAFMSVAKGSNHEPKLIVMRYFGDKANKDNVIGLVGKGLTYDSGGYSIKPTAGMVSMKTDMAGAAAVIGAMTSISKMDIKANVVAVVAACENLISGAAYKPGDIISSMAGKSIEILNTDAEGRLTLIDAVHYIIEKENATKVVDIATLTGAVVAALGKTVTGVVTNNDEFYSDLESVSKVSGEKVWKFPAFDEYKEFIKSDIADFQNLGGKYGGTITAGLFIGEFVQDIPWLHLDIAGTADSNVEKEYLTKGGTGVGVKTLYYLVKKTVECKEKCCCNNK